VTARRVVSSLVAVALLIAAGFVQARIASASFHLVQIREVFPGTAVNPSAEYIELQMWSAGQNLVKDHTVRVFDADGNPTGADLTFPANVPNGANQSTFILATPEAQALFGFAADAPMSARLTSDGGAVCWGPELDCVSWGRFPATTALPSPAGIPTAAIPDGSALRRSIAPGCPTLLESADDTNNSSVDFAPAAPAPRNNAAAPSETSCSPVRIVDLAAPRTALRKAPAKRTRDRTPTFRFGSDQGRTSFECKVDAKPFRRCHSPFTTKPLKLGKHTFKVRARSDQGILDRSPAAFTFTILGRR
jgi:hypothetical protein